MNVEDLNYISCCPACGTPLIYGNDKCLGCGLSYKDILPELKDNKKDDK